MDYLKNKKLFSFCLDGKNIWETEYETQTKTENDSVTTIYSFKGGLKVTNI